MAPVKAATAKKRRGRPPGSRKSDVVPAPTPSSVSKRGRPKSSTKQTAQSQQNGEDELTAIPSSGRQHKRVKRRTQADLDEIAGGTPKKKTYAQLEQRTKRIPVEQLETWPQISRQLLEQIVGVMRDAKRDIANTQRNERKRMGAYEALNPMIRRLEQQLANSRAPHQANEMQFNLDKLTEKNAVVSRDVAIARHTKQLLTEQIEVAEQLLKKDEENLAELKRDAKRWRTEWKQQQKHGRMHPLLQASGDTMAHSDGLDDIGLRQAEPVNTMLLDRPDEDLAPILEQLRRSLENLQSNHTQVEGINEALRNAQTALDEVLFRNATTEQYAAL